MGLAISVLVENLRGSHPLFRRRCHHTPFVECGGRASRKKPSFLAPGGLAMGHREAGRACNVFLSSLRTYVYLDLAYTGNRMDTREERPPTFLPVSACECGNSDNLLRGRTINQVSVLDAALSAFSPVGSLFAKPIYNRASLGTCHKTSLARVTRPRCSFRFNWDNVKRKAK